MHSSDKLLRQLRQGQLLRIRRGIYLSARSWAEAQPWIRYQIAICAAATARNPLFCRESALALHGIPLLRTPSTIFARTTNPGEAKTHAPSRMAGSVPLQQFLDHYASANPGAAQLKDFTFDNFPIKLLEPACPASISRTDLRSQLHTGEFSIPEVHLAPDALDAVIGPGTGYLTEPLGLAVLDTTSRMSFAAAVVALDAAKTRNDAGPEPWLPYLRTQRQRTRWERAWDFADGRAESALESESRVVLAQISCPAPTLQKVVHTAIGEFRMDFCWEREQVAGEVDGKVKYFDPQYTNGLDPAEVHYREKRRREALEAEGWKLVRWGKAELRNPQELIKRLSRAGLRPVW